MDSERFDLMIRQLGVATNRRSVLRLLAGGVLGLAGLGPAGARATTCSNGHTLCNRPGHCCSGICLPRDRAGRRYCGCGAGMTLCGGQCVDLQTDMGNCGTCGEICASGLVGVACVQGVCHQISCPAAQVDPCNGHCCDGDCYDPLTDHENCGICGNACSSGQVCSGGVCVSGT